MLFKVCRFQWTGKPFRVLVVLGIRCACSGNHFFDRPNTMRYMSVRNAITNSGSWGKTDA